MTVIAKTALSVDAVQPREKVNKDWHEIHIENMFALRIYAGLFRAK